MSGPTPVNQSLGVGARAVFNVSAGGLNPAIQWRKEGTNLLDGGNLSGCHTPTLTLTNLQFANGGNYSVIITNLYGSVTSSVAVLNVNAAPFITRQPVDQIGTNGGSAAFAVAALGTAPLTYQWRFNGLPLSGQTATNLNLINLQPANTGMYDVVVTNFIGSVTSQMAALTVVTPVNPQITWATPAAITHGTALSSIQLNATANVPGTFVYNPPAGTLLNVGTYSLAAIFTPADTVDYLSITSTVSLVVMADSPPYTFVTNNGTITITGYTGPGGAVVIPGSINGLPVTSIGAGAFSSSPWPTSIAIPSSVTSIGAEAFEACSGLTNIAVDAGNPAYASVSGVLFNKAITTLIQCPGGLSGNYSVPGTVANIGDFAFVNCAGLTAVAIPKSVTSLGIYVLFSCYNLTNIEVEAGNPAYASVGGVLFDSAMTTLLKYPAGLPGGYVIPDGIATIGVGAFDDCNHLTSVAIPNSVSSLADLAFVYCSALTNVLIPDNVRGIGTRAFDGCTMLAGVTIGAGVTSIGLEAFQACAKLTNLVIPNRVTSIGDLAFANCSSLTNIFFQGNAPKVNGGAGSVNTSLFNGATGTAVYYYGASGWPPTYGGWPTVAVHSQVPAVVAPPASQTVFMGENVTLGIQAVGQSPLAYQWFFNDTPLGGGAGTNFVISSLNTNNAGRYYVVVTNQFGATTSSVTFLSVVPPYDYVTNNGAITITGYIGSGGAVTIPGMINGLPVTGIGAQAFISCTNMTSVVIPNSISGIGDNAFAFCAGLTSVSIPSSVTNTGLWFYGCTSLTNLALDTTTSGSGWAGLSNLKNVTMGANVKTVLQGAFIDCQNLTTVTIGTGVTNIGDYAFLACNNLNCITIPNSVISIGDTAFESCSNLSSLTIGNCVTNIGNDAFANCTSLTNIIIPGSLSGIASGVFFGCSSLSSVTISNGATSIGYMAFYNCSNLTKINIPNSITNIGNNAFLACSSLISIAVPDSVMSIGSGAFSGCVNLARVTMGNSITSIGASVFYGCSGLTDLAIPNSVTKIDDGAFSRCTGLTSVAIPNSVGSIGSASFYGCSSLANVSIPNSVTSIGIYAFYGCSKMTSLSIDMTTIGTDFSGFGSLKNLTIGAEVKVIGNHAFSGCFELVNAAIGNSVTSIGDHAFDGCAGLKVISIPNSVTNIGNEAFYDCASLTSLSFGNGVRSIGDYAFYGCAGLNNIAIPDNATSIGSAAFSYCSGLTRVSIPNSITSIGSGAFGGCPNLTSLSLDMTTIGPDFSGFTSLKSLAIGPDARTIANSAFSGCSGLTSITIPNGVASIGTGAFYGCSRLVNVTLPNTASIGDNSFYGCSSLTSVAIPNGVTRIGNASFYGCFSLGSAIIGNGVSSIGDNAFYGCSSLRTMAFPNSVTSIGSAAFFNCTSLSSLLIPNSVTNIGDSAFDSCTSLTRLSLDMTTIAPYFSGSASLKSIVIGTDVKNIDNYAFSSCSALNGIAIPNTVTNIGAWAFYNCPGLSSVQIPNSVVSIGSFAFYNCTNLTTLAIDMTTIGPDFSGLTGLKNLLIGTDVKNVGSYAFYNCPNLTSAIVGNLVANLGNFAFQADKNLAGIYFQGNAPSIGGYVFSGLPKNATVYYLPGASGWGTNYGGLPTALWSGQIPPVPPAQIQDDPSLIGAISGAVLDAKTGAGLAGATLQLGTYSTSTDGNGAYHFTSVSPGNYTLTGTKTGYNNASYPVSVGAGSSLSRLVMLSPTNATTVTASNAPATPTVTSVQSKYSDSSCYLDVAPFPVSFTANVDWAGHPPGVVQFTASYRTYSVPANDTSVSQVLNMGTDFGPGGHLLVTAVSSDGTQSAPRLANFTVIPDPLSGATATLLTPVDKNNNFYYESIFNTEFFNELAGNIPDSIPIFKQTALGFQFLASVDYQVSSGGKATIQRAVEYGDEASPKMEFGGAELSLSQVMLGGGWRYNQSTNQWQFDNATLGIGGDVSVEKSSTFLIMVGAVPLPITPKLKFSLAADATIQVQQLTPLSLEGALELSPSIRATLTVGWDEHLSGNIWIEGGGTMDLQWPQTPTVKETSLYFSVGGEYYALLFKGGITNTWCWPQAQASVAGAAKAMQTLSPDSKTTLLDRDYLNCPASGAFAPKPAGQPKLFGLAGGGSNPEILLTPAMPYSDPNCSSSGTNLYLVFLEDNTNRTDANRTMAMFSKYDGTNWSWPVALADDGTADFHPRILTFADGSAVAAWENEGIWQPNTASLGDMVTNLEISVAWYHPNSGTWRPATQLTTNRYLDSNPKLAGGSANNVLLTWIANPASDLNGSSSTPNQIWSSRWDGLTWGKPQTAATVSNSLVKYDLAYDGTNGNLVMSVDTVDHSTNANGHELFSLTYQNGSWGALTQLTSDAVPDDNPRLAFAPAGDLVLTWLKGNELSSALNLNLTNRQVVRTNEYSSNLADAKLANNGAGGLVLLWSEPSENDSDLWAIFYDPIFQTWGAPRQMTHDPQSERSLTAAFYGTNELVTVYNRTWFSSTNNLNTTPVDLVALYHTLDEDLALDGSHFNANPANPAPGSTATLTVEVLNLGDKVETNVVVAFYLGTPQTATQIGRVTLPDAIPPQGSNAVTFSWQVPATGNPVMVCAVVDPDQQVPDVNRTNNAAQFALINADMQIKSLTWSQVASNLLAVVVDVSNDGVISNGSTTISFNQDSATGTTLFSQNIEPLAPGQSKEFTFLWNTAGLPDNLTMYAILSGAGISNNFAPGGLSSSLAISQVAAPWIAGYQYQTNGSFQTEFFGTVGHAYTLLASTDLANWIPVLNFTCTNAPMSVTDPGARYFSWRFYRMAQGTLPVAMTMVLNTPTALDTNGLGFNVQAPPGFSYVIQTSTNLIQWQTFTNFTGTNSVMFFWDKRAVTVPRNFYRVLKP